MKPKTILLSEFIGVLKSVRTGTKGYSDAKHLLPILQQTLKDRGDVTMSLDKLMTMIGK
jgi:hypothetical protein